MKNQVKNIIYTVRNNTNQVSYKRSVYRCIKLKTQKS